MHMHVAEGHRLWTVNTPCVPAGVDDAKVRQRLLNEYGIEIAGGFGPLAGKVFRIGLMGYSSTEENVAQDPGCIGEDHEMRSRLLPLILLAAAAYAQTPAAWTPEASMQVRPVGDVVPSPDAKLVAYTESHAIIEAEKSEIDTQIFLAAAGRIASHAVDPRRKKRHRAGVLARRPLRLLLFRAQREAQPVAHPG